MYVIYFTVERKLGYRLNYRLYECPSTLYPDVALSVSLCVIGYGNIAPKTFWGRLVCIAYAVLGIPLMLLCLANLGEVMANIFRFVYARICCCGFCRSRLQLRNTPSSDSMNLDQTENCPTDPKTSLEKWKADYEAQRKKSAILWAPEVAISEPRDSLFEDIEDDDDNDDDDDEDLKIT